MASTVESANKQNNDDDISVATATTENRQQISYKGETKEYVLKFLFRPKGNSANTEVAKTHFAVLQAMKDIYPEIEVYDNFGGKMKSFPKLQSYEAYLRHFKLQFVKANDKKSQSSIYLAFHRIMSPVPISEIRKHSTIANLLQKVNTRLTVHL